MSKHITKQRKVQPSLRGKDITTAELDMLAKEGNATSSVLQTSSIVIGAPFKVMQWNMLSDGLSADGFVGDLDMEHDVKSLVEAMVKIANDEDTSPLAAGKSKKGRAYGACIRYFLEKNNKAMFSKGCAKLLEEDLIKKYYDAVKNLAANKGLFEYTRLLNTFLEWGSTAKDEDGWNQKKMNNWLATGRGRGREIVKQIIMGLPDKTGKFTEEADGQCDKNCPDILALEENDHNRFMQLALGIPRVLPNRKAYQLVNSMGFSGKETDYWNCQKNSHGCQEDGGPPKYPPEVTEKTCKTEKLEWAYSPKYPSNSRSRHVNGEPDKNDDDGSSLFWNKERFEAKTIQRRCYDNPKQGGILCVLLKDKDKKAQGYHLWACTTHLASGDEKKKEQTRVAQIELASKFMVEMLSFTWRWAGRHDPRKVGLILMMDGNAHAMFGNQGFPVDKNMYHTLKKEMNVMTSTISTEDVIYAGLTNFVDYDGSEDWKPQGKVADPKRPDLAATMQISVNKIRGVGSEQLKKVGQYQLDLIDYALTSSLLAWEQNPGKSLPEVSRLESKISDAYASILPNMEFQSDHLPLRGILDYKILKHWIPKEHKYACPSGRSTVPLNRRNRRKPLAPSVPSVPLDRWNRRKL